MTEQTELSPTSDERMLAALAHFFGIIGALVIWVMQKDKSRFVRFQAAQALAFDILVTLAMMGLSFCLVGMMFIGIFGTIFASANSSASPENFSRFLVFPFLFPTLIFTCIFPFSLALWVARIAAAVSVLSGNHFRYPLLGARVEKFLAD